MAVFCVFVFYRGSSSSSGSSSESVSAESEEESGVEVEEKKEELVENHVKAVEVKESKSNLDLLLDLDISDAVAPVMTPSLGGFLTPINNVNPINVTTSTIQVIPPVFYPVKEIELLDRISGRGLNITYRYTRNPHLFSPNMVNINLSFKNTLSEDITDIRMGKKVCLNLRLHVYYYRWTFRIYQPACRCTILLVYKN